MCTMIAQQVDLNGSAKGAADWFTVRRADVSYDHPFHAPDEHALCIDFVDVVRGPGQRVAIELSAEAARELMATIQAVLERAEAGNFIETERAHG
jgi:hypothetical protein